ncbi:pyridoxamine 5'-phosphate oxidase family protein [Roseobacter ponti]|uniref:Pyridoxamine 5'-phosphate oxidase family protein n=1 Tax=Roseobacter ponti TaxID=1891787 RepID=A0A858SVY8_9RHOB|nr:pyridoxamine 5'-phosphate oxidase family protein [Roseobacter ponti]QJF52158.1 pyridoxamine 5'-phosphate oxidase family protein [Roseobacter ponti]
MEHFGRIMFTGAVEAEQRAQGSYDTYARMAERPAPEGLGGDETAFLTARTSLYMATVSATGWPYVQHRGGPAGFIKVLDPQTIGFADYRGNRQYVSSGHLRGSGRVSLFAMDYARQARLKLIGHAAMIAADADPDLAKALHTEGGGKVERTVRIRIEAFDWNCPQFITPRFDTNEIARLVGPEMERLEKRNAELEAELAALRAQTERETK